MPLRVSKSKTVVSENISASGLKRMKRAARFGLSDNRKLRDCVTSFKALGMHQAILRNLDLKPLRKSVDHRGADAVKAAGNLVAAAAEFSAGVKTVSTTVTEGSPSFSLMPTGIPLPLSFTLMIFRVKFYLDAVAKTGQRFVYGVIDYFIDEMMKPSRTG